MRSLLKLHQNLDGPSEYGLWWFAGVQTTTEPTSILGSGSPAYVLIRPPAPTQINDLDILSAGLLLRQPATVCSFFLSTWSDPG